MAVSAREIEDGQCRKPERHGGKVLACGKPVVIGDLCEDHREWKAWLIGRSTAEDGLTRLIDTKPKPEPVEAGEAEEEPVKLAGQLSAEERQEIIKKTGLFGPRAVTMYVQSSVVTPLTRSDQFSWRDRFDQASRKPQRLRPY